MTTLNPTPEQIRQAMLAKDVPVHLYAGWNTIGREWAGPDGSKGLQGVIVHHTANPSATGDNGIPSLKWVARAFTKPAANWCIGRDGEAWLLSAGSCFHSGNGGPWPAIGVPSAGMHGHYRLAGIEIDDPGHSNTITAAQIDTVSRILAAYQSLCGWGWERIITHGDWTDAGAYLTDASGLASPVGPYKGRKIDTLRRYYSGSFWRQSAQQHATVPPATPGKPPAPAPKPLPRVSLASVKAASVKDPARPTGGTTPGSGDDVLLVEKALVKVGLLESRWADGSYGTKTREAYANWQRRTVPGPYDGIPGITSLNKLAYKTRLFKVVK